MKQKLSALIIPEAEGVKVKLVMALEDTSDDEQLIRLHRVAIAELDETLNRMFEVTDPAFTMAEDISFSLAAFKYENPVDLLVPSHIQNDINKIRFHPGF